MLDSKKEVRVRLHSATLTGEMLLDGQAVDRWLAFRALDRWIDETLRG